MVSRCVSGPSSEGTVLGEISLYRDEPHTATAVADTDCDVLHLTPERFEDLCREAPAVAADSMPSWLGSLPGG